MIEGGWPFVWAAYGVTFATLAVLALAVAVRALHWAARARELTREKQS